LVGWLGWVVPVGLVDLLVGWTFIWFVRQVGWFVVRLFVCYRVGCLLFVGCCWLLLVYVWLVTVGTGSRLDVVCGCSFRLLVYLRLLLPGLFVGLLVTRLFYVPHVTLRLLVVVGLLVVYTLVGWLVNVVG